ncbi:MAG: hypothetical protein K8F91_07535 [Candidatus Obscuribacterales bacterium]|nr:hypothetical protein [Candidatus Obscuribacterales bacterium]
MTDASIGKESPSSQLLDKLAEVEKELVEGAKKMVKSASDPFSGVINFLHQRPENVSLEGSLIDILLIETFGSKEEIPGLIRAISCHVREIIRQSNVIQIINHQPTAEKWGNYIIKKKERIKFEVGTEKGCLVLKNIKGLFGTEHGVELPLEKITVMPPKLIVTLNMGLVRPQKVLDI